MQEEEKVAEFINLTTCKALLWVNTVWEAQGKDL